MFEVATTVKFDEERIRSLLCGAFEGGSDYWMGKRQYQLPEGITLSDFREQGKFTIPDDYNPPYLLVPFHEGCSIAVVDDEDQYRGVLNRESMVRGLQLMADKYPNHFADFMQENDDATTSDVFLQLSVFGELIFG